MMSRAVDHEAALRLPPARCVSLLGGEGDMTKVEARDGFSGPSLCVSMGRPSVDRLQSERFTGDGKGLFYLKPTASPFHVKQDLLYLAALEPHREK